MSRPTDEPEAPRDLTPEEVTTPEPVTQAELDELARLAAAAEPLSDEDAARLGELQRRAYLAGGETMEAERERGEAAIREVGTEVVAQKNLLARGYIAVREGVMGMSSGTQALGLTTLDEAMAYAKDSRSRAELQGADQRILDGIDTEVRILNAFRHLCQELNKIGEGAQARARLRGEPGA